MKSSTERSRELRKRKAEAKEFEIRGVYAKKEYHRKIKQDVKNQIKRLQELQDE